MYLRFVVDTFNIYIRKFMSSVQKWIAFIFVWIVRPFVIFEWAESRWNMYYCASSIYFSKEKQIHHVIKFSFLFRLTDSYSQLDKDSIKINIKTD